MIRRSCGSDHRFARVAGLLLTLLLPLALLTAPVPASAAVTLGTIYGGEATPGAAGNIREPDGIGVDPIGGRVAVASDLDQRVSVFAPDGTFLFAIGKDVNPGGGSGPETCTSETTCQTGTAGEEAGELGSPEGATFSPDGKEIFVAESSNRRVSVFNAVSGAFKRAFGYDVNPGGVAGPEVCTTSCQAGAMTDTGGAFSGPRAISFGPDKLAYIADFGYNRIDVWTPGGSFKRTMGADVITGGGLGFEICSSSVDCKQGSVDVTMGALGKPAGLDFGPDGRLWVGSYGYSMVRLLAGDPLAPVAGFGKNVDPGGGDGFEICTTSCQMAMTGPGPGELETVFGIAVAGDGTGYVADSDNNRISAFNPDLSFAFAFGRDVDPTPTDPFETCTPATGCKAGLENSEGGFDFPYGVAVDCRGTVYVVNSNGDVPARAVPEEGVEPGPCELEVRKAKLSKRKGTAKLKALVPYPGGLTLSGKGLKKAKGAHEGLEGTEQLKVKPKGKLAKKLKKKGKAKVKAKLTMKPTDGNAKQKANKKLKLKRKGRGR